MTTIESILAELRENGWRAPQPTGRLIATAHKGDVLSAEDAFYVLAVVLARLNAYERMQQSAA